MLVYGSGAWNFLGRKGNSICSFWRERDKQKFSFRAGENGAIAIKYKWEPWSGKNETVTRQSLQASAAQWTAHIQ
nr:hypothetical protein [Tanacetum cinerariifolium]